MSFRRLFTFLFLISSCFASEEMKNWDSQKCYEHGRSIKLDDLEEGAQKENLKLEKIKAMKCAASKGNHKALGWLLDHYFYEAKEQRFIPKSVHPQLLNWYQQYQEGAPNWLSKRIASHMRFSLNRLDHSEEILGIYKSLEEKKYSPVYLELYYTWSEGKIVSQNWKKAMHYARKSYESGREYGSYKYALGLIEGMGGKKDKKLGASIMEEIAGSKRPKSDRVYGYYAHLLFHGIGLKRDREKAVKIHLSIPQRHWEGENYFDMYKAYHSGRYGVTKDREKAFIYKRMAGLRKHVQASFELGKAYELGKKVPKDIVESIFWYGIGIGRGHQASSLSLARAIAPWTARSPNFQQDLMLLMNGYQKLNRSLMSHSKRDAAVNNAMDLYFGITQKRNRAQALKMLQKQANAGNDNARKIMEHLKNNDPDLDEESKAVVQRSLSRLLKLQLGAE